MNQCKMAQGRNMMKDSEHSVTRTLRATEALIGLGFNLDRYLPEKVMASSLTFAKYYLYA